MAGVIYTITTISDRVYVGQSRNHVARWREHRNSLKKGNHHCIALQRSYAKFKFVEYNIVEEVIDDCDLTEREQHWMEYYSAELLNSSRNATHSTYVEKTAEERQRLSEASTQKKQVVLRDGRVFDSLKTFAVAAGYPSYHVAARLLSEGVSPDDIIARRIEFGHMRGKEVMLSSGQRFANRQAFANACGYKNGGKINDMLERGYTLDSIAQKKGIYRG